MDINVAEIAIQKYNIKHVINQLNWWIYEYKPIIFINSRIFNSFSSTIHFTVLDTGYNVDIAIANPNKNPTWLKNGFSLYFGVGNGTIETFGGPLRQ